MKKICMLLLILCAASSSAFALASADAKGKAKSSSSANSSIAGKWKVVGSTAVFTVSFKNGKAVITGEDSNDGEKFVISDVSWDGRVLKGKFYMPSTKFTTVSELEYTDADTLKGSCTGDYNGDEQWSRIK